MSEYTEEEKIKNSKKRIKNSQIYWAINHFAKKRGLNPIRARRKMRAIIYKKREEKILDFFRPKTTKESFKKTYEKKEGLIKTYKDHKKFEKAFKEKQLEEQKSQKEEFNTWLITELESENEIEREGEKIQWNDTKVDEAALVEAREEEKRWKEEFVSNLAEQFKLDKKLLALKVAALSANKYPEGIWKIYEKNPYELVYMEPEDRKAHFEAFWELALVKEGEIAISFENNEIKLDEEINQDKVEKLLEKNKERKENIEKITLQKERLQKYLEEAKKNLKNAEEFHADEVKAGKVYKKRIRGGGKRIEDELFEKTYKTMAYTQFFLENDGDASKEIKDLWKKITDIKEEVNPKKQEIARQLMRGPDFETKYEKEIKEFEKQDEQVLELQKKAKEVMEKLGIKEDSADKQIKKFDEEIQELKKVSLETSHIDKTKEAIEQWIQATAKEGNLNLNRLTQKVTWVLEKDYEIYAEDKNVDETLETKLQEQKEIKVENGKIIFELSEKEKEEKLTKVKGKKESWVAALIRNHTELNDNEDAIKEIKETAETVFTDEWYTDNDLEFVYLREEEQKKKFESVLIENLGKQDNTVVEVAKEGDEIILRAPQKEVITVNKQDTTEEKPKRRKGFFNIKSRRGKTSPRSRKRGNTVISNLGGNVIRRIASRGKNKRTIRNINVNNLTKTLNKKPTEKSTNSGGQHKHTSEKDLTQVTL